MRALIHRLAHAFGWNEGHVEAWWEGRRLMVGHRCNTCGRLAGIHESPQSPAVKEAQEIHRRCEERTREALEKRP